VRLGFISQYYAPEPGSAGHPAVVAGSLARRGHDVTALTGFPSYPRGEVFDGYRQRLRYVEQLDDVRVTRVPYYVSHDESGVRRAATMLSFGLSAALQAPWILRQLDAVVVYASPATTVMAAMLLRAVNHTPYVLYVQDLWPDSVTASGMLPERGSRRIELTLHAACRAMYRQASAIAVISPGMKEILVRRGVPKADIAVVPNWVDESVLRPARPMESLEHAWASKRLTVMYAGGVGELQGLDTAIEAMSRFDENAGVHLVIVGEGVAKPKLQRQVEQRGIGDRVSFLAGRPLAEMPAVMAAADVQLISLRDRPLFHATLPSKFQVSMAVGQPVLVSAPGDAGKLAQLSQAGIEVPAEDPEALAAAILKLRDMPSEERLAMGQRGRAYYSRELSEEAGAASLERLVEQAVS
jgi:colanic acid biosynthesis glycosyl transferase WcaI